MRSRILMTLVFVMTVALMPGVSRGARVAGGVDKPDPISGEWTGRFQIEGNSADFTFKLKLNGSAVAGTAESDHTGPGTVSKGEWSGNKISFSVDFAAHDSIEVTGILKDGKLAGEFRSHGRQGTWEATKKAKSGGSRG